jgi:hypothetical protein
MKITINMSDQELAAIKNLTHLDDSAAAVGQAAREFVRLVRLRELKSASGKVEIDPDWQKWEALELSESPIPQ